MKNLLNNLSKEEKNRILEQHSGGIKIMTKNFSRLINSKLGNVKPMLNEVESNKPELNCDWFVMDTNLVDGVTGELHFSNSGETKWVVEKFSNPNNDDDFTLLTISIPKYDDLEVIWNKAEKRIELHGEKSLMALKSYNDLNRTNDGPESCNVVCTTVGVVDKFGFKDPDGIILGKIKLSQFSGDFPGVEPVKVTDGAIANISNNFYKTRKSNYKFYIENSKLFTVNKCKKY